MTDKVKRFTNSSRRILNSSQNFAQEMNNRVIDTPHILYAMTEVEGDMNDVLTEFDIIHAKLRPYLKAKLSREKQKRDVHPLWDNIAVAAELSEDIHTFLRLSVNEARQHRHVKITDLHLLADLLQTKQPALAQIWAHFRVDPAQLLALVRERLEDSDISILEQSGEVEESNKDTPPSGCWGIFESLRGGNQ